MGKRKGKKKKEELTAPEDMGTCQECRFQSNNPSFCHVKERHVPRKWQCDKFKAKR